MTARAATLNVFQKTQRLWDTIHPYNAAQAMELVGDFPPARVADSFNAALADLGLGEFVCDGRRYFVRPADSVVNIVNATESFDGFLTREMNRPFAADVSMPFRPFDVRDGGRRFVGLTYQHWVADSVSIRLLMRQWLDRLTGTATPRPVRLPAAGLLGTFGPATGGWSAVAQAASIFSLSSRMRKMRRVESTVDRSVRVTSCDCPSGLVEAVRLRARGVDATVGDVFLAAAAEACDSHGPGVGTRRRPGLCMGTIVDLRARSPRGAGDAADGKRGGTRGDVFGLFLGFLMTDFSGRQTRGFKALLARAAGARRTALARRSAEASQLNLALGYLLARRFREDRLLEFYRKRFPVAGGLSSVNMTPGWAGAAYPSPLAAYRRVSPTGPMLPLVLTPTTLGERLGICFTYRAALLDRPRAAALLDTFVDRLVRFAG